MNKWFFKQHKFVKASKNNTYFNKTEMSKFWAGCPNLELSYFKKRIGDDMLFVIHIRESNRITSMYTLSTPERHCSF